MAALYMLFVLTAVVMLRSGVPVVLVVLLMAMDLLPYILEAAP